MRDIGIQIETHYASGAATSKVRGVGGRVLFWGTHAGLCPGDPQLLDKARIRGIFINEGITRCRIVYYMAVAVDNADSLMLVFEARVSQCVRGPRPVALNASRVQHSRPRLDVLSKILAGTRSALYGEVDADDGEASTPRAGGPSPGGLTIRVPGRAPSSRNFEFG